MPADLSVLFCADPLRPARVEQHFVAEAATVREGGGVVALVDHDALVAGDADAAVRRVPRDSGPWWYRGWMVPAADYTAFAEALRRRAVRLRVSPHQYRRAHELPGWYSTLRPATPESYWMDWSPGRKPAEGDVAALVGKLGVGAAIVKDFVKSRKHEWDEACFIPDVTDLRHAAAVVARMVELQDETLNGGVVLRRFEALRRERGRTGEARVWWVDGVPVAVTAHPDSPDDLPQPDLAMIAPLVAALGCPFVTTDVARRVDGAWRVIEVGDGQVSDLPSGADSSMLYRHLTGRPGGPVVI